MALGEPFCCPDPGPFAGRRVSLATCHGKERLLARPFRRGLDLTVVLANGLDTDVFGTFSGERPRPAAARETCRRKAEAGMVHTGLDLGLASEGSFGPHPALPWLTVGTEWLTFLDRTSGLVIADHLMAPRTNFDRRLVSPRDDIQDWLRRVGFPSHALIARPYIGSGELARALELCVGASSDGHIWLETDMRAHCNPTRRAAIRTLAFRLVRRIASLCLACGAPGWALPAGGAGNPRTVSGPTCGRAWPAITWRRSLGRMADVWPIPVTAPGVIPERSPPEVMAPINNAYRPPCPTSIHCP